MNVFRGRRLAQVGPTAGVLFLLACCAALAQARDNLLQNPGFEEGDEGPAHWRCFPPQARGVRYVWEEGMAHSGERCACVEGAGRGFGMWQQVVPVQPGAIYVLAAWVRSADIAPPGKACLQLFFRDAQGRPVQRVDLPGHAGTIPWLYDFPHELFVRAPKTAAKAEVNLYLEGRGTAWFDDVFFGPAPMGTIAGRVTCEGQPVAGARVFIWGTDFQALTDGQGQYTIAGVPDASPRYVVIATKQGFRDRPVGDVDVRAGKTTVVDFELARGNDPKDVNLRAKFGALLKYRHTAAKRLPEDAVIDRSRYPAEVKVYLKHHEYVDCESPVVREVAQEILNSLPEKDRTNTAKVAYAVYWWIVRNVEYDVIYSRGNFVDTTSGMWQTISGEGWCWGHNFMDWLYTPSEMLREKRGICIEHSRLAAALLRALNIPARPIKPYGTQFWVQPKSGEGFWCAMSTSGGRSALRERGDAYAAFARTPESAVRLFPIDAGAVIHSDWYTENKCLWREIHPWSVRYPGDSEGLQSALADLEQFGKTGFARRERRPGRTPRFLPPLAPPGPRIGEATYEIDYSDVTINLLNIGNQRRLHVRFPFPMESDVVEVPGEYAYWTNHPEWITRTWVSEERNPPVQARAKWFNLEFDVSRVLQ